MFQFRRFPLYTYVFSAQWLTLRQPGFPIQKSTGKWIFAPNRGLSQLITSFIGSQCQGIHPALLFALPIRIIIPLALSKIRLQQICCGVPFSLNRTRCLVLLKYLNGYFNIILILILKIFLYEVFKVQCLIIIFLYIEDFYQSLIRHPPTLPHRRQCSTIGRLGLNHRVRDGNGCFP